MLESIRANIAKYGHHIYLVSGGPSPRYAYTIGLSPTIGAELTLAGAAVYSADDVKRIINDMAAKLKTKAGSAQSSFEVKSLGSFTLRKADPSWASTLMLGALDFYGKKEIEALQIVPDQEHWSIDIANMVRPWSPTTDPVWQWLHAPWRYPVSPQSVAVTNLGALRGERITEAARWEPSEWELFAGAGPDVPREEVRMVPLGTLLAVDESLDAVTSLDVGHALWRDATELEWHPWNTLSKN